MKKYDTTWIEKELENSNPITLNKSDVELLVETLKKYGKETFSKYLEAITRRFRISNRERRT